MYRFALAALVVLAFNNASYAKDERFKKCFDSAMDAHIRQLSNIHNSIDLTFSVEQQILIRRINEEYCLKQNECLFYGVNAEKKKLLSGTIFSTCLEEQEVRND